MRSFSLIAALAFVLMACEQDNLYPLFNGTQHNSGPQALPPPDPLTPCPELYDGPAEICPFLKSFLVQAAEHGIDATRELIRPRLQVQIAGLEAFGSGVIGLCETDTDLRRVTFDPDYWNSGQTFTQKQVLSEHEFGHCLLYRPHRSDIGKVPDTADGTEELSIMYPIILGDVKYARHVAYYLSELFLQAADLGPGVPPFTRENLPRQIVCRPNGAPDS